MHRVVSIALAMSALSVPPRSAAGPYRQLQPVVFTEVKLSDSFWLPRIRTHRAQTLPHNLALCEQTGRISNFAKAAGLQPGEFEGIYFNDSDLYKVLEGCAYTLATEPDAALAARVEEIVRLIAAAQQPDGYLNTYYTLVEPDKKWTDLPVKHELYCAGHLFEAAVAHYRATGTTTFLDVARRLADHIDTVFGPGRRSGVPGHEEIELALVKLYEATGEERYFNLAKFFIDERGQDRDPQAEYRQAHLPVREQDAIVGHAVRAMYLYSGVADAAGYTGDPELIATMDRIWRDVTLRKMYVTGGIGPSAHNEGFTQPFDLPNHTAYAETCAAIGMVLWNHRLCLLHADARYADVMELALYNGFLAGVSLDGVRFFYVNPLASKGDHHRQSWYSCACCPTNVARLLPSVSGYLYAHTDRGIWANLYAASEARIPLAAGPVRLVQQTDYPWDGRIRIAVAPAQPAAFVIHLRIPGWCAEPRCLVNGEAVDGALLHRGYLPVEREWKEGDTIELELPMPVRRLIAHPEVRSGHGRVALQRGPLVYCLEAVDNGGAVRGLVLPRNAPLQTAHLPELLGGVTVIRAEGLSVRAADWAEHLYREAGSAAPVTLTAIPYYAWDNRDPGEMAVWIAEAPGLAEAGVID